METRDDGDDSDGLDQRDRLEDEDEETGKAPPGFLSPSVREYLELGRSIPGNIIWSHCVDLNSGNFSRKPG